MATDPSDLRDRADRIEAKQRERERERERRERERRQAEQQRRRELLNRLRDLPDDALEKLADGPGKGRDVPGRLSTRRSYFLGNEIEAHNEEIEKAAGRVLQERRQQRARADGGTVRANSSIAAITEIDDRVLGLALLGGLAWAFARKR